MSVSEMFDPIKTCLETKKNSVGLNSLEKTGGGYAKLVRYRLFVPKKFWKDVLRQYLTVYPRNFIHKQEC